MVTHVQLFVAASRLLPGNGILRSQAVLGRALMLVPTRMLVPL